MKKYLLGVVGSLLLLFTIRAQEQPPPRNIYEAPRAIVGKTASGAWAFLQVDGSNNLLTAAAGGSLFAQGQTPPPTNTNIVVYALIAQDSGGNWHFLQVDNNGNLLTSGSGGGGSGTVSGQASGVIPLGTSATVISGQSHCNDGNTITAMVTCTEPLGSGGDGTHAGTLFAIGNTTLPTVPSNSFYILAPNSASFSSWGIQPPTAGPTGTSLMELSAVSGGGNLSTLSFAQTTGSGLVVLNNSPTLITPILGAATGTSLSLSGGMTTGGPCVGCGIESFQAGVGGTTVNTLVQLDTSNPSEVIPTTTDAYGIALGTAANGVTVLVQRSGSANCVTDTGGATAGHLAIIGSGTAIDCKDSGQTAGSGIALGTVIVGKFLSTATAGATAVVELEPGQVGSQTPTVTWNSLASPTGNQALTMTGFSTTWSWATNLASFDTNGNPTFGLVSTTTAVVNSPTVTIQGSYQATATPTFAADNWTLQNVVGAGTNGTSILFINHGGTTGQRTVGIDNFSSNSASFGFTTNGTSISVGEGIDGSNNLMIYNGNNKIFAINVATSVAANGIFAFSSSNNVANAALDTGMSRDQAGEIDFGNGTQGNVTAFLRSALTVAVGTSNFTTASTSLVTITGLSWTLPVNAHNYSFKCNLSYSQATAAATNAFGIQAATTAPTNVYAAMDVKTSLADAGVSATLPTLATTTATNIGTFTPSAAGAIGTVADIFTAEIWGYIEQGAGATTLNIMALSGSGSDSLTIYRGSSCSIMP